MKRSLRSAEERQQTEKYIEYVKKIKLSNMNSKNLRPRSNLQFAKPPVKPSVVSSSLTRKSEALQKYQEENEKLKEEIQRLKIKVLQKDASTETNISEPTGSDVSVQTSFTCAYGTRDVFTETDICDYCDVSTEIDLAACVVPENTNTASFGIDASVQTILVDLFGTRDDGSVPNEIDLPKPPRISLEDNELTEGNARGVSICSDVATFIDIRGTVMNRDVSSFNFPHLPKPEIEILHIILNDEKVFDIFKKEFSKYRAPKMQETVREVCQHLISDEFLQDFSYLGRRGKYRLKDYHNVSRLIVHACAESIVEGKFIENVKERKDMFLKECQNVERYFCNEYIKQAKQRWNNAQKK